ncbi:MAG: NAD(P)/FAD-dependent oxidoreductase [Cyanobium sp.]
MLRLSELKLPLDHRDEDLPAAICRRLRLAPELLRGHRIVRRSVDARRRDRIQLVYCLDLDLALEPSARARLLRRFRGDPHLRPTPDERYRFVAGAAVGRPWAGGGEPDRRPLVIGAGPCGYFAALLLAQMGLKPLLLERGRPVKERTADTFAFWRGERPLNPDSNAQFGEGGAGTFSDGKLYSQVSEDPRKVRKVLQELVEAGAQPEILTRHRPHIGTFKLATVVRGLRRRIEELGGEVRFGARVEALLLDPDPAPAAPGRSRLRGVRLAGGEEIAADRVILAPGHSARDTFARLQEQGVAMECKPLAIGLRIEHPQALIDRCRWGPAAGHPRLGAAEYKLVHHTSTGRDVYSFCMCPGGLVVGATSEPGCVVTNGMSQHTRNERNANSGLVVNIRREDMAPWGRWPEDPLAGIAFQRHWEACAFRAGGGDHRAPAQWVEDFLAGRPSRDPHEPDAGSETVPEPARHGIAASPRDGGGAGDRQNAPTSRDLPVGTVLTAGTAGLKGSYLPGLRFTDLSTCLPDYVVAALREALPAFERRLPGFSGPGSLLTGVETRTSSPLRLQRDADTLESINVTGLYPGGEGAGHAGGILSAAIDGIRLAEAVALSLLRPPHPGAPAGSACDPA